MEKIAENRCFDGLQLRYKHLSSTLKCEMHFSIFLPPLAEQNKVPVIYWLSGLTCTDLNFVQKAGAQRLAAQLGVAIVAPDTSPRGEQVPTDPEGHWSFGHGAGFYVDATEQPWAQHYQMHSYVRYELPELIESQFPVTSERSIMGHSMGGHGALTIGLKHADFYRSISAFAPICNPVESPWGQKALNRFLGEDKVTWRQYDASCLLENAERISPIKIDQGAEDEFLVEQLMPEAIQQVIEKRKLNVEYGLHEGYDHSYFFIASFIDEHLKFHCQHLGQN